MDVIPTGIAGLDAILRGGLPSRRSHLIEGCPGMGKTTLGLQFLLEGARLGEPCLYVTFGETREEIADVAKTHGWSVDRIAIYDHPTQSDSNLAEPQTVFQSSEVEATETAQTLREVVERVRPRRAVIDGMTELRLLFGDPLNFRHHIMLLKQLFAELDCTLLLLHDCAEPASESGLRTLVYGVIELEVETPNFGPQRRRIRVLKMRGVSFHSGYHDCRIIAGGLEVFPRLVAAEHRHPVVQDTVPSGLPRLDAMLGGGLARGTSTILMGPAGTGKSTFATQYALAAARRGERSDFYLFEESMHVFLARAASLGLSVDDAIAAGRINLYPVDYGEYLPGELMVKVMGAVEEGTRIVVIDSLSGYLNAMPEERSILLMLSELLSYLGQAGVLTFLIVGQHGLGFTPTQNIVDLSYLADNVLVLRYFEYGGVVRKAISCFKKRTGGHETSIRDVCFDAHGITIGEPLTHFRGILTGVPVRDPKP